jgi:mannose-1-phosphate guanylyltransferase
MKDLYICILAGGSGERFWPLSRTAAPKHLLRLFSEKPLLEQAVRRALLLVPITRILVLTNHSQIAATRKAIPFFPAKQIIAEPVKRDTAPACALATALVKQRETNGIVALIAADHIIRDGKAFAQNLKDAARMARESNSFVTFSITPTAPSPDLGYLEKGATVPFNGKTFFYRVKRFVEKPDSATAAGYIATGKFGWNSGMFVWSVSHFLAEAKKYQPDLARFIEQFPQKRQAEFIAKNFPKLPKISVDYAIMEKSASVIAARADFDWDDVGTWGAIQKHLQQDAQGNVTRGAAVLHNASNNTVLAQKRFIALCGVNNLIVVETADAVLVCDRNQAAQLKNMLGHVPEKLR